jgi:hypothetical protein
VISKGSGVFIDESITLEDALCKVTRPIGQVVVLAQVCFSPLPSPKIAKTGGNAMISGM